MSVLVLALIATVVLPRLFEPVPEGWVESLWASPDQLAIAAGVLPQVLVAIAAILAGRTAVRRLRQGRGGAPHRLRVQLRSLQWLAVLSQAIAVQFFGWLGAVRAAVGDLPGADELLALVPALAAIGSCWWAAHPMEKLLRPALAARRNYVLGEFRNQLAILGVPALLAIATLEASDLLSSRFLDPESALGWMALPAAMLIVLVFSPVAMISVLDTTTLAAGTARRIVDDVLRDNGLSLRRVLIWKTGGTLLNGAVVGVLHPWRYLLLTDAVLNLMSVESLRAIVAHEVGHLRRRHLPWLVVVAAGILGASVLAAETAAATIAEAMRSDSDDSLLEAVLAGEAPISSHDALLEVALPVTVAMLLAFVGVGWVSRRFERQADTFAVQYLSLSAMSEGDGVVGPESAPVRASAVLAMCRALGRVAELNGVEPRTPSWRHGSIQSRQRHLVGLLGQPVRRLRIDRQIVAIKMAGVLLLAAVVAIEVLRSGAISWEVAPAERSPLSWCPPHTTTAGSLDRSR